MKSKDKTQREPQRDMDISKFGEILMRVEESNIPIEAAVFFDDEGETIDYFTYRDPFSTRLLAAHLGIVFQSAKARLSWLRAGEVDMVEIRATLYDSVTLRVGMGCFLSVLLKSGELDHRLLATLEKVAEELRDEL
jgi:predicted regulator of Ras-like GTPase activity (Roadblock/LC7/MglB family)